MFRNPGATGSIVNLNQIEFVGQGAATTAPPLVSVNAIPATGNAPLNVVFDTTASDPDGAAPLSYSWSFGDGGGGASTQPDPNHVYAASGNYVATLTVTDADGGVTTVLTPITVGPPVGACPTGFRDDFNGTDLAPSWSVLRRDQSQVANGLGRASRPTRECGVVQTETPGEISGTVPGTLALSIGAPGSFGVFIPGVGKDYTASMAANVISTATAATLSVKDPSFTATGRLVNGSAALAQPLHAMATNSANPSGTFAPLHSDRSPLRLLSYADPVSNDAVTIGLRQTIGAGEPLFTGSYAKTLVFTLSTSTP